MPINVSAERQVLIRDLATGEHRGSLGDSAVQGKFSDSVSQILGNSGQFSGVTTQAAQNTNVPVSGELFSGTGDANVGFT